MRFLCDANVLSEATKSSPQPSVLKWLARYERQLAVNPIILGELQYGILRLPPSAKRRALEQWFTEGASHLPVVEIDATTAAEWARLLAELHRAGCAMPVKDSLVAASARQYRLAVATRNVADFAAAGVKVINPFAS